MENRVKSGKLANNSTQTTVPSTKQTSFEKLTKQQLIELLQGNIKQPITPDELYRSAVSIVARWCNDVIKDNYASMYDLTSKLEALKDIYRNR